MPTSGQLSPLRIAVKDCYFLKGMKNSLCNSAYYNIMPPAPFTAAVVESLARDGSHILGLTKLSTMIGREEPMDAVDYLTPFNPRADGYQSPAGSSSGSAAAVAAYDWVDCAIGTDTSGSGRRPALVNGVWQFRPTHNPMYLNGLVKTYDRFDTPCVYARSLQILERVVRTWLGAHGHTQSSPRQYRIIYPLDYLPRKGHEHLKIIDNFLMDMEDALSATIVKISIRDTWKVKHPEGACEDLDEYLHDVVTRTFYYGYYHAFEEFRKTYPEKHDGKPPYVIPFVQRRWDKGAAVSDAQHADASMRMEVYKQWLLDNIFHCDEQETFVILPISDVQPNYRDEFSPSPEDQSALDQLFLSPILGAPDISVPIGEVSYTSRISQREERLPVLANIVGAPGHDLHLFYAIRAVLAFSGRPDSVLTGSRMFP